jgi:hypothetical protein
MRVLSEPRFIDVTYRKFFNQGELPHPSFRCDFGHRRFERPRVTSVRADGADEVERRRG